MAGRPIRPNKGKTEFGRGCIQQLIYLAYHISHEGTYMVAAQELNKLIEKADKLSDKDLANCIAAMHPIARIQLQLPDGQKKLGIKQKLEKSVAHCISMWAYGARDHAFELMPSPKLSKKTNSMIIQVKALMLRMGSTICGTQETDLCTFDNFQKVRDLIAEIGYRIDREMLGLLDDRGRWR